MIDAQTTNQAHSQGVRGFNQTPFQFVHTYILYNLLSHDASVKSLLFFLHVPVIIVFLVDVNQKDCREANKFDK